MAEQCSLRTEFSRSVQVLNALAPLQQEQQDMAGADAMLKSSFTLSKNLQDLHSQVCMHAAQDLLSPSMHNDAYQPHADVYRKLVEMRSYTYGVHAQRKL